MKSLRAVLFGAVTCLSFIGVAQIRVAPAASTMKSVTLPVAEGGRGWSGVLPPGFPANSNVQIDLMQLNPGNLIFELPGAPQDFGTIDVIITAPSAIGCPAGTVKVS